MLHVGGRGLDLRSKKADGGEGLCFLERRRSKCFRERSWYDIVIINDPFDIFCKSFLKWRNY